jgi:transcriptional regulator with XRE-family HTH domain
MNNALAALRSGIKSALAARGLTAAAASRKAGLGKDVVRDILSGKSANPGIVSLLALAEALGCDLSDLVGVRSETKAVPVPSGPPGPFAGRTVVFVIGGGIAAYKALDLIRRLRERGAIVRAVMTRAAQEFVTPLSVGALTGGKVFTGLFDRDEEHDVGHIRLAREADAIVVAPATADLMARMAAGRADDLATAVLLAASSPVLLAPAMNPKMWSHPATARNRATLAADGVRFVGERRGGCRAHGRAAGDRRRARRARRRAEAGAGRPPRCRYLRADP